jgi:DNA-binding NtrC family response regulator
MGIRDMQIVKRYPGSITVLAACPDNEAHADLREMLNSAAYRVLTGCTVRRASSLLDAASVVICEEVLPDGTWRDVLAARDPVQPLPALIVTSPTVGPHLWAEVLNLGGYDVLAQPFSNREVLWSLRRAHSPDRTASMRYDLGRPAEPSSRTAIQLSENGHRCTFWGNDRLSARKNLVLRAGVDTPKRPEVGPALAP